MKMREKIMDQYESLTLLLRPGDYKYSSEEIGGHGTSFAEGVIKEELCHHYPLRNQNVKGKGWTFYKGQPQSEYDYYIVCCQLPHKWRAYGCSEEDYKQIKQSFENNPFMIKRN